MSDGPKIPYPIPVTLWQQAEFTSTALTALTLALLATLISYQVTALMSDLVLGWKPRNVARIHTFQSLLLSRKGSPIAILNALFRSDFLTRFYFQGNLPARAVITRDHERIRPKAVFLLLTLLVSAPLVNILVVVMTIEDTEDLTFAEAGFPNVSFGIWNEEGPQIRLQPYSEVCSFVPVDYHPQDTALSRFLLCSNVLGPEVSDPSEPTRRKGSISILNNANISLKIQVQVGTSFMEGHYQGNLKTRTENLRLLMNATRSDAERMAWRGVEYIQTACGSDQPVEELERQEEGVNVPALEEFLIGFANITCPDSGRGEKEDVDLMVEILSNLTADFITLTNATSLQVTPSTSSSTLVDEFRNGSSEVFVTRRTRLVGIPVMAILAGLSVIARLLVAVLLNNDVNDGMERILKERVGLPHCASLLREEETVVSYNTPREDAEGGKLHPLRSYGAGSSFLPALSQKTPSASQRTLVMFDGLSHGSTDWNRTGQNSPKDQGTDTGREMI